MEREGSKCRRCASPIRPGSRTLGHRRHRAWPSNRGKPWPRSGPSGAGKSTLFDLLPAFLRSGQQGRVCCWTDSRSSNWTRADLRRSFGPGRRTPAPVLGSVEENIRYGRPHASAAEGSSRKRCRACPRSSSWVSPQGYATHLARAASAWSGGQRQRLAIAGRCW
ncbi:ATP-binding cassette domain-containing protein [Klebsiella pneumoniae]